MQHKLIMLMGSAPGSGKSTLSEFLFDQFARHAIPARWIYEEDVLHLDTFTPVVQAFRHGQGDAIEALLATTSRFVQDTLQANAVIVTDSIFPAYTWLFAAGYTRETIANFSVRLGQLLHPLQPLTIYLNSDVATSLARAVAQRGTPWLDGLITTMQTYTYCQTHPVHDMDDVIEFFEAAARLSVALLADWPHTTLFLDTTSTPLHQITTMLLERFGLSEQIAAPIPTATELHPYVGRYVARDNAAAAPLVIRLVDGELIINTYWPNGCRLIPEGLGQFRLQGTNRRVIFTSRSLAGPRWLTYVYGGNAYKYDSTAQP